MADRSAMLFVKCKVPSMQTAHEHVYNATKANQYKRGKNIQRYTGVAGLLFRHVLDGKLSVNNFHRRFYKPYIRTLQNMTVASGRRSKPILKHFTLFNKFEQKMCLYTEL